MSDAMPQFTRAGFLLGVRLSLPILPGIAAFALAYGTVAVQKGLTLAEAAVMSALVYAGASQLVGLEIWTTPLTPAAAVAVVGVVAAINLRLILMGAALRPWLGGVPARQVYPALGILTDANWVIALRYRAEGGNDWAVLVGSGLVIWMVWAGAAIPGYLFGALVADPRRWGLDLMMPAFFVAMLVPLWRGPRRSLPWIVSGVVSLATAELVAGYWFIVTGAVTGSLAGAILGPRDGGDA
ncbi:AzlC family ABC transporter permease [Prosthecomicrobium sp. N25]|uniref:AzlC family ABC transporter permease n=1 Tax=Prosthecomicrobium sp. N25 TaxID=3129254 RepID=UPI00307877FC